MLIQTINLSKSYSNYNVETSGIQDINLTINQGDFISIMGPSGCGKSTLLNLLGLLDAPTEGQILYKGEDVSTFSPKKSASFRRDYIGFVFQNFNLIDSLNVYENIELPLVYQKIAPSERKRRVHQVMERLNILHKEPFFPKQISGGQQQRVALARAVVTKPELVLADEPTGNLDSARGQEVMELLAELNENGTTVVMVTHSQFCSDYAQKVLHLFDGQLVTENIHLGR
ncbi:ABC transporter ATP-binding protein [Sediminitomix flava]|uniref:Putative ABC transport system ATP-binding protein n=1 Tax=Sediminitomix flava TaxID=379075 RepID=A0A315ZVD4_SEDFL|nr:ABC transporter ATP-binding protein [Sediminitomix flava]PWJ40169.1 putative ABC transport system ATP-binding protein [Sediminitomix flava]